MAFFCYGVNENENLFTCKSSFSPYIPPVEVVSLQSHLEEEKKTNKIEYLPGERLLIQIDKETQKKKKKKKDIEPDVQRISKSLARVLKFY
jgi:hypothetical protein